MDIEADQISPYKKSLDKIAEMAKEGWRDAQFRKRQLDLIIPPPKLPKINDASRFLRDMDFTPRDFERLAFGIPEPPKMIDFNNNWVHVHDRVLFAWCERLHTGRVIAIRDKRKGKSIAIRDEESGIEVVTDDSKRFMKI